MATNIGIKASASGLYKHSYDVSTVASMDFAELVPIMYDDTVLKDKRFKYKGKGVLRVAPSDFPAYGKLYVKHASFFVPEHQIFQTASGFHDGKKVERGQTVVRPYFERTDFTSLFYRHRAGYDDLNTWCVVIKSTLTPQNDGPDPDRDGVHHFIHITEDENAYAVYNFCRLTSRGKKMYKVLKGLGYDWPSYASNGTAACSYGYALASASFQNDAISLLAYAKIYVDYFMNTHMYNSSPLVDFLRRVHENQSFSISPNNLYSTSGRITVFGLDFLLTSILLPYEQNYYTRSWNTPNSPLGVNPDEEMQPFNTEVGSGSPISPFVPSDEDVPSRSQVDYHVNSKDSSTYLYQNYPQSSNADILSLSKLGLNWLNSIYRFVRRNNLFGSRSVDNLLARFGIKADDWKAHYAHKLDEGSSRIDFSAVLSNTDSTNGDNGKPLGAYAGFAVAGLDFDFNYEPRDFGCIVTLAWLQVVPMIVHGQLPHTMRRNFLDFWQPEFDGKTIRPIPQAEVSVNINGDDKYDGVNGDKKVFGYMNYGDDYRFKRDVILGDFVTEENVKNFVFARDFGYLRTGVGNRSSAMRAQTNRIQYYGRYGLEADITDPFQFGPELGDRFYLYIDWNIDAVRPILPVADSLDLEGSGDTDVQLGGSQMS